MDNQQHDIIKHKQKKYSKSIPIIFTIMMIIMKVDALLFLHYHLTIIFTINIITMIDY